MTRSTSRSCTLFLALSLIVLTSANTSAQLIVGNDQSGTATIYNVNPSTGAAVPIYSSSSAESKPWGMAYDPGSDTLYWNNGGNLYSSPMGATLTPTLLGGMTFNGNTVNFVGLGFRNGKLVGTRNIATEAVYEIDVTTLVATQTFAYATQYDFGGLDVDATNGVLYGLSDSSPAPITRGLYEIDDVASTVTFRAPYPAGETDIDGLAVYNGLAYYITDGPNSTQPNFYVFDVATGSMVNTLPSPFTGSGTFSAGAYVVPEPGTLIQLTGLGVLLLVRRFRNGGK